MTRVVTIDLLTRNLSPGAYAKLATEAELAAAKSAAAFDASTSRIGRSLTAVSRLGSNFDVPFTGALSVIGVKLDETSAKGKKFGSTMSAIGGAELLAAGAGIAFVGLSAVHAADSFDVAHARLVTAVKDTGQSFSSATPGVSALDDKFIKLGYSTTQTENALSILTTATHDVSKAQADMGLTADIARARNKDLGDVAVALTKAAQGNYTSLIRLGVVTKDQTKNFHSMADVVAYLGGIFGGQSAAYADTFAGKLAQVKAQANQLEVTLGTALIPKIESLASSTVGAVQGFERANTATGGWLGKLALGAAAVPVLAFGMEKLGAAGAAAGGALDAAGVAVAGASARVVASTGAEAAALTAANGARLAAITSDEGLVVAEDQVAVAAQRTAAAETLSGAAAAGARGGFAVFGAALPYVAGGLLAVHVAGTQLADTFGSSTSATDQMVRSLKVLADTGTQSGVLVQKYGANWKQLKKDIDEVRYDSGGFAHVTNDVGNFIGLTTSSDDHVKTLTNSLKKLYQTDPSGALSAFESIKAHLVASGESAARVDKTFKGLEQTIGATGPVSAATQAQTKLTDAQQKYYSDIVSHKSGSVLAADYAKVKDASGVVTSATNQVQAAMDAGASSIAGVGAAADATSFAYLGLASSVHTAQAAISGIEASATTSAASPYQFQLDTSAAQASADALHGKLDQVASGGGGGSKGSGQTAIAKALDQTQKELSVRDARRGVETATFGVVTAETQLAQARQSNESAQDALTLATQNYRTVLHGVAADSLAAKQATEAFTQAKDAAAGGKLDVADARRALQQAKNDQPLAKIAVNTAQATLTKDVQGGASADQILQDQIALKDAKLAASAGDEAVKRAQIALTEAQIAAGVKTRDLTIAQKTLGDTLHGYPANSQQAKDATDQLTGAQLAAKQAAQGVTSAQQQLQAAQDQTATSALGLKHAIADMNGQLTSAAGGGGGAGKMVTAAGNLITKLDDLRQKSIAVGNDVAAAFASAGLAAGQSVQEAAANGILANIASLQASVAAEPLLAHAFDSVIASYRSYVAQIDAHILSGSNVTAFQHPKGKGLASGGPVQGNNPSGIPILAHPGEYVLNAKATQKYGEHVLSAMNAGVAELPSFGSGGPVGHFSGVGATVVNNTYKIEIKALDLRDSATLVNEAVIEIERINGPGSLGRR